MHDASSRFPRRAGGLQEWRRGRQNCLRLCDGRCGGRKIDRCDRLAHFNSDSSDSLGGRLIVFIIFVRLFYLRYSSSLAATSRAVRRASAQLHFVRRQRLCIRYDRLGKTFSVRNQLPSQCYSRVVRTLRESVDITMAGFLLGR